MMSKRYPLAMPGVLMAIAWSFIASLASAAPLSTIRVASGLTNPVYVTAPATDPNRLFIVEQGNNGTARIKILDLTNNQVAPTPFLTVNGLAGGFEQGLLGMAFHPDYASNGKFYVNFTLPGGAFNGGVTHVREYQVSAGNPNVADVNSARTILTFDQPQSNHNGGWIGFSRRPGDAGNLYIATGDGGGGNDDDAGHTSPGGNAQDKSKLLGKMLRINIDADDFPTDANRNYGIPTNNPFVGTAGARGEIWTFGLRNPFRASFDRGTGNLFIGDVGQSAREEIDFQAGDSPGGENYGWRAKEGSIPTPGLNDPIPSDAVDPIYEYGRTLGGTVIGGYVYRGNGISNLDGTYFLADYIGIGGRSTITSFLYDGATVSNVTSLTNQLAPGGGMTINRIVSFGEDALGELYIVDHDGEIYKIVPEPSTWALAAMALIGLVACRRRIVRRTGVAR